MMLQVHKKFPNCPVPYYTASYDNGGNDKGEIIVEEFVPGKLPSVFLTEICQNNSYEKTKQVIMDVGFATAICTFDGFKRGISFTDRHYENFIVSDDGSQITPIDVGESYILKRN
jgi:hypothetical protein